MEKIQNKKIFVTGGAGFLGTHIIERYYKDNIITVYSRDESKHYYLKKHYPKVNCIIGDIRNYDLMKRSASGHDIGIFAASLKQIGAVDQNIEEAAKIIIDGAINSRRVAEEVGMEAACFISSDKSRAATTIYGAMKFVAGESFIVNSEKSNVRLSSAIYGNVLNSTGSIIPLMWDAIKRGYPLTLYSDKMTRFMIDIDNAIDLIEYGLNVNGYNVIPNLKSFLIKDLFEIFSEKFNLKYIPGVPRISEKLHEMMISIEEAPRTFYDSDRDIFYMHYKQLSTAPIDFEFTSDKTVVSKQELDLILSKYNYFKPL
jgi:UDP-N-acetylglucosamine 4,6-dehydratase/5-epimerase